MTNDRLPIHPLADAIRESFEGVEARIGRDRLHMAGTPSGWVDFDILTAGLPAGALWAVCGRAGYGKTTFLTNLVRQVALGAKKPIFVLSAESSRVELAELLLVAQSRVGRHAVRTGRMSSDDLQSLMGAGDLLKTAPLFISGVARLPLGQVVEKVRAVHAAHGVEIVVVDSLDAIEPDNTRELRHEQIHTISRELKAIARELNVLVVASVRLNPRHDAPGHAPQLADLRQNWPVEHEADAVFLLHRPGKCDGSCDDNILEVAIAKHRSGPTGAVTLGYTKECSRLDDYSGGGFEDV